MTILVKEKMQLFQRILIRTAKVKEKSSSFQSKKKSLYIFLSFISKNLSCDSFFTIQYKISNKIKISTLINTYITRFGFIDKKFAEIVYQKLEIKSQCFTKQKLIQGFDSKATKTIIYIIYLMLFVGKHTKSFALLLIVKLGQYPIIVDHLQRKKT